MLCHAFSVVDIVKGTATMRCRAVAVKFGQTALIPELHGEADDRAALALQDYRNGRGVDAARHRYRHQARLEVGACGPRSFNDVSRSSHTKLQFNAASTKREVPNGWR